MTSSAHKGSNVGGWPLVQGRLRPPGSRSVLTPRPRVCELLNDARDFEVILVAAPSGYGKTTAVSQWLTEMSREDYVTAWVSLDEMDSEPTRILMYLVASLSNADTELEQRLQGLFDVNFETAPPVILRTLLAVLESFEQEIFLVVDDLHGSLEPEALAIFSRLVNHGLANLHLTLILRDAVELPLARAKMRRAMLELGPAELQFTAEEAQAYFATHGDLNITREDLDTLFQRTDGWIAGLQLAVLSLRDHQDPKGFIQSFSGHNRDVADLLAEEVLARLPAHVVDFLEQTSVLSSFNAGLCDELLGRQDSAQLIQRLEDGNFFIFPMDDERAFYRYHRLFAEHLRRNLEQRSPDRIPEIHLKAAEWFRDNGLPVRACLHAARTGDLEFLGEMLDAVAPRLRELGYGGTVLHYATLLPQEIANQHPRMQLDRIYALTLSWRFDEAREVLEQVRRTLRRSEGVADEVYPELVHREGQLALLSDDHVVAERLCEEWLSLDSSRSAFEDAVVRTSLICSRAERYEFDGLDRAPDIRRLFRGDEMRWATVWHDSIVGACYTARGDLGHAERLFRGALATASSLTGRLSATPSTPAMYLAELLYERDQLAEAQSLIDQYFGLATEMGMLGQLAAGFVTRARLLDNRGDSEQALRVLDEGEMVAERRGFERLHHIVMLERYRILLEQGSVDKCFRIARADGLMASIDRLQPGSGSGSAAAPQALAWAAISLARNKQAEAADLLERWRKYTVARGALRPAMQFTVMGIRAAILKGDKPRAAKLLREVLLWSNERGFVRSVMDGGQAVLDLLHNAELNDVQLNSIRQQLLRRGGMVGGLSSDQTGNVPVEALNARETQIMKLAEQGLMNKQIASELGLTVGTVKWYMQQIFAKLDVRRRAQAIHKAKHLGFIR